VGYAQIVLGDEIEIPTLHGTEKIRIPAGTESDSRLKLKGKGLIDPGTGTRWDQIIKLKLHVPHHLGPEQRKIMEQLFEIERLEKTKTGGSKKQSGIFDRLKGAFSNPEG
ncbi:MAG: DnaJ C-terminal domain-containing protein, partial [Atribacterota bacterium]